MEEEDRKKILINLNTLVNDTVNFDRLLDKLIEKRVFNEFMVKKIQDNKLMSEKIYCLYEMIPRRGPDAFKNLIEALHESGNNELAKILKSNRCISNRLNNVNPEEVDATNFLSPRYERNEQQPHVNGINQQLPIPEAISNGIRTIPLHPHEIYPVNDTPPQGYMLVINVNKFDNNVHEERKGSLEDVDKLETVGLSFGYKVSRKLEVDKKELMDTVKAFAQDDRHKDKGSAILFIMTHGKQPVLQSQFASHSVDLVTRDNSLVSSDWVIDQFSSLNCPHLADKPKIIFFVACRGDDRDYGLAIQSDSVKICPRISNLLMIFPCLPGNVSFRNQFGSFMVQEFINVLRSRWQYKDIGTMLEEVSRLLKEKHEIYNVMQVIDMHSMDFDRKFFFHQVSPEHQDIIKNSVAQLL